jgi:hypothetical protein
VFIRYQKNYPWAMDLDREEKQTLIGGIITVLFILFLVIGVISIYFTSKDNPSPAPSPTVKEWSEPNFDNLDQDGFVGGQR